MSAEEVDVIEGVEVEDLSAAIDNAINLGYLVKVEPAIYDKKMAFTSTEELKYQVTLMKEI